MNKTGILNIFKTQLVKFCDELIQQFPNESEFVIMKVFLKDTIPIEKSMTLFINAINKDQNNIKIMIKERNEDFFINHNPFNFLSNCKDSISKLTKLWEGETLSNEDKDIIWNWIDVFVKISDKYLDLCNK